MTCWICLGVSVSNIPAFLNRADSDYVQRWPMVGESPELVKVSVLSGTSSSSTVTLTVEDHSFRLVTIFTFLASITPTPMVARLLPL